jgi:hypothetical protein
MYYCPFSFWFSPYGYWFHSTLAHGTAISHLVVDMPAPQALRAMVSLFGSSNCADYQLPAVDTVEWFSIRSLLDKLRQWLIPPNEREAKLTEESFYRPVVSY